MRGLTRHTPPDVAQPTSVEQRQSWLNLLGPRAVEVEPSWTTWSPNST
jgi:hypothetical protein